MKFIVLHTCQENEEFAVNPELIFEIGNDLENLEPELVAGKTKTTKSGPSSITEDEIRVVESQAGGMLGANQAILVLAARPFVVGNSVKFSGLTRVPQLNGQVVAIRSTSSSSVVGYQITLGSGTELVVHNYTTAFPTAVLGEETGYVSKFIPQILCGFISCCGGERVATRETLKEIVNMIITAGIGSVHDPDGIVLKME